jgi:hypothetical protein
MTCVCLCFLLQGEPLRNRAPASQQDDGLHHGVVRHGAHLQCSGAQTGQADYPEDGSGAHEGSERSVIAALFPCPVYVAFPCLCSCSCSCSGAILPTWEHSVLETGQVSHITCHDAAAVQHWSSFPHYVSGCGGGSAVRSENWDEKPKYPERICPCDRIEAVTLHVPARLG